MGTGYTTILYDGESLKDGIADIGACRYDGIEIGLEKVRYAGPENVATWLDRYNLDLYCVMSEWLENDEAVNRVAADASMIANLGAEFLGLLPPQRGRNDDETVQRWLEIVCEAAKDEGLRPVVHHHGGTHIESPAEIREWLDRSPENLELLYDTAHYYPYGDPLDGIDRFSNDIAYVHLKDISPSSGFPEHTEALTSGDFHLDDVITYFRAFTDLWDGTLEFDAVADALNNAEYSGEVTIEIENRRELPLVHAKQNLDHWRDIADDQ